MNVKAFVRIPKTFPAGSGELSPAERGEDTGALSKNNQEISKAIIFVIFC